MIQIRCFDITQLQPGDYEKLYARASSERKSRADRYRRREDSIRCIVADALLGLLPGFVPENLKRTPEGKPYLQDRDDLYFNLSHSGRWVVIAWGNCPVGIDVEQLHMDVGKENIARRYFCPHEQAYVFSAEGEEREKRFFQIWTMKESYLKYLGTGITRPLNSFSVLEDGLGVILHSEFLPDACMTLCTGEDSTNCRMLTPRQLLAVCGSDLHL